MSLKVPIERLPGPFTARRGITRLGTKDALKDFHHGWIEACLGNRAEAAIWYRRALALNPTFSILWAPVARKGAQA